MKKPRHASTYRGARRNAARGFVWKSTLEPEVVKDRSFKGSIYENSKFKRIVHAPR